MHRTVYMHPCTPLHAHNRTVCDDGPTGSETPLPQQVPILSNSSQRGPTDKASPRGYTYKTLALKYPGLQRMDGGGENGERFIYECEQGESISIIYTHTHTNTPRKKWGEHDFYEKIMSLEGMDSISYCTRLTVCPNCVILRFAGWIWWTADLFYSFILFTNAQQSFSNL